MVSRWPITAELWVWSKISLLLDLWRTNWHCDRFIPMCFRCPGSIIPPMSHIHSFIHHCINSCHRRYECRQLKVSLKNELHALDIKVLEKPPASSFRLKQSGNMFPRKVRTYLVNHMSSLFKMLLPVRKSSRPWESKISYFQNDIYPRTFARI